MSSGEPALVVGRYALHHKLASGGMGSVYLGRLLGPIGFARTVAIKRLHEHYAKDTHFVAMFLDEARLTARIRHPNVVPTLDVVAGFGEFFLVMDYIHGVSLRQLLGAASQQGVRLPVEVLAGIIVGALHGLHGAHQALGDGGVPLGIVHRDVSPQNVMVGLDGVARIVDFGVAKAFKRLQNTTGGALKGKIAYVAPEQVNGDPVGPWTDLYSAAVVFWEALTNCRLFGQSADASVMARFSAKKSPVAPSTYNSRVSPQLDEIVLRALQFESAARFASAREMADAIEAELPVASNSVVARWVERLVGSQLQARAALIDSVHSQVALQPGPAATRERAPGLVSGWTHEPPTRSEQLPANQAPEQRAHQRHAEGGLAHTAAPRARADSSTKRRFAWLQSPNLRTSAWVVALTFSVVLLGSLVRAHSGGPAPALAAASSPLPLRAEAARSGSSAALAPDAPSNPLVGADAHVAPAPAPASRSLSSAPKSAVHGRSPLKNCEPPYVEDSRGIRHLKLECLR